MRVCLGSWAMVCRGEWGEGVCRGEWGEGV